MKKILCLVLAVLLLLSLAACSENEAGKETAGPTDAPATKSPTDAPATTEAPAPENIPAPKEIERLIADAVGLENYLAVVEVPKEELYSCALAEADLDKLESYVAKQALVSAVNMDTVVVAKCKEADYAEELVKIFQMSYDRTMDYVRQYPFSVAKAENARLYRVGDTVMLILAGAEADAEASEEDAAKLAVSEYEKIDAALEKLLGFLPENLIRH